MVKSVLGDPKLRSFGKKRAGHLRKCEKERYSARASTFLSSDGVLEPISGQSLFLKIPLFYDFFMKFWCQKNGFFSFSGQNRSGELVFAGFWPKSEKSAKNRSLDLGW